MSEIESYLRGLPKGLQERISELLDRYGKNYLNSLTGNNRSRVKAAKEMYRIMDLSVSQFLKDNLSSCRKGCAHCCHVYVYITIDEALLISNHCRHNKIEIDRKALLEQSKYTKENWPLGKYRKCVFLDWDNSCKIYPIRPMACRKFYVASAPVLCDTTTGMHHIAILNNLEAEVMASGIYGVRDTSSMAVQLLKVIDGQP